jgi:hypothetical protein
MFFRKRRKKIPRHKVYQLRIASKNTRRLDYLIGLLSLVVLIFLSSAVLKVMTGETSSLPPEKSWVKVQVLNGCGISKAAAKTAKLIRAAGVPDVEYDVIDEDNFESYDVSETMIIARDDSNLDYAKLLASALGIKPENVVSQELKDNYLSIGLTIVVGKDFQELAADSESGQK